MRLVDTVKLAGSAPPASPRFRSIALEKRKEGSWLAYTKKNIQSTSGLGKVISRTFCLACLHGVHAIRDTLPRFRRFLEFGSPPLPGSPPAPPPASPLAALLGLGVAAPVLDSLFTFVGEEAEESCGIRGTGF